MMFRWSKLAAIATLTVACGAFSASSRGDPLCDAPASVIRDYLPPLPKGCHGERVQASGGLSFNVVRSAEKIAEAAWQREALTKYGERYQDLRFAACKNILCVKGAIAGTRRCTISAFPCAADMDQRDVATVQQLASRDFSGPGYGGPPGQGGGPYDGGPGGGYYGSANYSQLNSYEIMELQRFLGVTPDGVFGQQSQEALSQWRRTAGMRPWGPPTREDLERIRRGR